MVTGIDIVQSQIQIAQGYRVARPGNESAPAERYCAEWICAAMPRHHGRPCKQFPSRLRQDSDLPFAGGLWHPPGWRFRVWRRGHHSVLRFLAGQSDRVGPRISAGLPAHGPLPSRVPHSRREDQHSVSSERRESRTFSGGRRHHFVSCRDARAVPIRSSRTIARRGSCVTSAK